MIVWYSSADRVNALLGLIMIENAENVQMVSMHKLDVDSV